MPLFGPLVGHAVTGLSPLSHVGMASHCATLSCAHQTTDLLHSCVRE